MYVSPRTLNTISISVMSLTNQELISFYTRIIQTFIIKCNSKVSTRQGSHGFVNTGRVIGSRLQALLWAPEHSDPFLGLPSHLFIFFGCFAAPVWHYNSVVYHRSTQKRIQGMSEIPESNLSTLQPVERLRNLQACITQH